MPKIKQIPKPVSGRWLLLYKHSAFLWSDHSFR